MEKLFQLDVQVRERVFTKDPATTELGRRIVQHGILLIDELGFERFTIGKLASALGTAETSVYRYFPNKHRLLIYLVDWYWAWRELKLVFETANIDDPRERLVRGIRSVTAPAKEKGPYPHVDLRALYRIAVAESAKAWLNKDVDSGDREGHFGSFVRLSHRLRDLIQGVDRKHPYPTALASLVIEGTGSLSFFNEHLPSLMGKGARDQGELFVHLVLSTLNTKRP
ncbi:MAG: TetR/AcrR family transcriptional regulator [Flavobacteriales bacterium]|nr:TetR/AcrR family transcriptional regulator [Flavobacteriales bacterium]